MARETDAGTRDESMAADYARRVADGEGFMPWQKRERGSPDEVSFRAMIEERKTRLLAGRAPVCHPVTLTADQVAQARRHIASEPWAQKYFAAAKAVADYVAQRDDAYLAAMIPELTPTNPYGISCPNCVGRLTQECSIYYSGGTEWDYRNPDVIRCKACGQVLPDARFPEEGRMVCPRTGQTFTYYINPAEQSHPEDRSGRYAWKWANYPIHVSFEGILRERKVGFMIDALHKLGVVYALTGEPRYARAAVAIFQRLAHCYRFWLYHDYCDSYVDCDPMYAAWHYDTVPLEWKRNPCADAYGDKTDGPSMVRNYFGAGRIHASCDVVSKLMGICRTYDLAHDARDADGRPLWTEESRAKVERDFLLEYIMGAERWLGGHLEATNLNNKAGRAYCAVAAIGKCMGLPGYADTALRGYEALLDKAFLSDGHSGESPFYSFDGFLSPLIWVPEMLDGFEWPADYKKRTGTVRVFESDTKLRMVMRTLLDCLRPNGLYVPLSDTRVPHGPSLHLLEIGLKHYPDLYGGTMPTLSRGRDPSEYALFNLTTDELRRDTGFTPPEVLFPAWKAAILRHGDGPGAACLALPFNNQGIHLQNDSLSLYYADGGDCILGDHGYMCDTPMNGWIYSTFSHNVVIVDDAEQEQWGRRVPSLRMMASAPGVSVVEAESNVYGQCGVYQRLAAMVKGPGSQTFVVDIFRVRGGRRHAWQCFSEIGASDAEGNGRRFVGLDMPAEPPLPNFGGSVDPEHISRLRDARRVESPPAAWEAIWSQKSRRYRLHVLSPADAVEATNGPGQEDELQVGRRVRYLNVIRQGENLASTFVAIHEPGGTGGETDMPIIRAQRVDVPAEAGPDALAVRIKSRWGTYFLLNRFDRVVQIEGVRFRGEFGVLCVEPSGRRWLMGVAAETFKANGLGYENATPSWSGRVVEKSADTLTVDADKPADWPATPAGVTSYVRTAADTACTGFPVASVGERRIVVGRFPLIDAARFELPAVRCAADPR
ncbi:MAG: heparinase II/III-family protein [Planctomycetes bacterium]|nr:heparinase II/III-family protein [Planctomycetota bacterium]